MGFQDTGVNTVKITHLKKLIQQGESQYLEFKKSTTQIKPAFETACAFLNNKGGIVLIGVKDNGQIIGQEITDETKKLIANESRKIEPKSHIDLHYVKIDDNKHVIVIEVPSGKYTPYIYDGRPFERNQSTTERMTQHRYEQLIIKRGQLNHAWEEQPAYGYDINDLDHDEIRKTIKDGIDQNRIAIESSNNNIESILTHLKLIIDGYLTNAAVVLFAKEISSYYSQCAIKLARFRGNDKLGDFIDSQWIEGNTFQLIRAAQDFTVRHLPIASYFEKDNWQRIDQPIIPALALREALINAISHRDYTVRNSTISLAIYDNRLELWNVGELPNILKLEDLKKQHGSYPRNINIASVFYKRGWIETRGIGINRMVGFCHKNKTPEPEFTEYSGGFSITFPFKEPMHSELQQPKNMKKNQLSARQNEIIAILNKEESMTTSSIKEQLNNPPSDRTLRYELANLKEKGIVKSSGSTKSTIWSIVNHK